MPTLAQLEEKYDCPAYCSWSRVPKYLKPRHWFKERGVNIGAKTKPDAVIGWYQSFVKYFLFNIYDYDLESFFVYEIWAYKSKKEAVHLFSGKDEKKVEIVMKQMKKKKENDFLLYEIREEKYFPVKVKR